MNIQITENQLSGLFKFLTEKKQEIISFPSMAIFNNDWNLLQTYIEKKGNPLYKFESDLDLSYDSIETLGNLISVDGSLDLFECDNLEDLGELEYVGGYLDLRYTKITELGSLKYVGGNIYLDLEQVNHFTESEIREKIKVGGKIGNPESY